MDNNNIVSSLTTTCKMIQHILCTLRRTFISSSIVSDILIYCKYDILDQHHIYTEREIFAVVIVARFDEDPRLCVIIIIIIIIILPIFLGGCFIFFIHD